MAASDDIRVNPYAHLADRVLPVRDQQKERHRRDGEHKPEEPQDVVELGEEPPEAPEPDEFPSLDDGLDFAV